MRLNIKMFIAKRIEMLKKSMKVYYALYSWVKYIIQEHHNPNINFVPTHYENRQNSIFP